MHQATCAHLAALLLLHVSYREDVEVEVALLILDADRGWRERGKADENF
jgi:hypothetical protein